MRKSDIGLILMLLGVILIAVYFFGLQYNSLLVAAMILQAAGIVVYIVLGKREK